MPDTLNKKILRSITKDVARKAEKIVQEKLSNRLDEQEITLDFGHNFQISDKGSKISLNVSYEGIKGEQRERVRGYSYQNKNGKTVNVKGHNRVNKDKHSFKTENGKFITSDEIPDEVFMEVFTEAVQEALADAFQNLKL